MNNRRKLLVALGASVLAAPLACFAQQQKKVWRIGFLANGSRPASLETHILGGFSRGMRELGHVEGKDYIIEWRFSEGKKELFESAAMELVKLKVDIIIAATSTGVAAARQATATIPIVMVQSGDPVGQKFAANLSRPGGNITGLTDISMELSAKYLELLRLAKPKLASVAVLANRSRPIPLQAIQDSAKTAGIKVFPVEARTASQLETTFGALMRERVEALIVQADPFHSVQSRRIAELAVKHRLPTMFWTREHVEAGGLMSYGQNNAEHYHRAAFYVDKIVKGAKPGDLPIEQPTIIELVINLKTAKAIGLTIPQDLLFRADKVIE